MLDISSTLNNYEDQVDNYLRRFRKIVPTLARILLLSTFVEDSFRMVLKFSDQKNYFVYIWRIRGSTASFLILLNLVTQVVPSLLILTRRRVHLGCSIFLFNILFQHLIYWMRMFTLFKTISLCGVVLLLYGESFVEAQRNVAGLPEFHSNSPKRYFMFMGRIFVVFMLITMIDYRKFISYGIFAPLCGVPSVMVMVGYRAKVASSLICLVILINMVVSYPFWMPGLSSDRAEYYSFEFFQSFSVIGGFLILVAHGPGGISLDEYKKLE